MFDFPNNLNKIELSQKPAITCAISRKTLSYQKLTDAIHESPLSQFNSRKLVAIEMESKLSSVLCYLACFRNKHVVWLIDPDTPQKASLYQSYQPNFIVKDGVLQFHSHHQHKFHDDLQLLLSTSGSTGSPKLVKLSGTNLQSNAESICRFLPIGSDTSVVTTLPFHYSFGLSVLNTHLRKGSHIIINSHAVVAREFWQLIKTYRPLAFYGVPTIYDFLLRLGLERLSLDSIQFFAQAGGKLAKESLAKLHLWACTNKKQLFIMYGQTEATARIAYLSPAKLDRKLESIGQAIPGGQLSLIDNSGKEICEVDRPGELIYSGPNVMMGYASSPIDFTIGEKISVLRTGDLATVDDEGDYYIVGRKKRFIKLNGIRTSLDEVENYICSLGTRVACTGEDDLLVIAFRDNEEQDTTVEQLRSYLKIKRHQIRTICLDAFPLKSSGKIDYAKLLLSATEERRNNA